MAAGRCLLGLWNCSDVGKKPRVNPFAGRFDSGPQRNPSDRIPDLRNVGLGRVCVIIANGPSHAEVDLGVLAGDPRIDLIQVGRPNAQTWPTKYWAYVDQSRVDDNMSTWTQYSGTILTNGKPTSRHPNQIEFRGSGQSWCSDPSRFGVHVGKTTTYFALQLAAWMGYRKIFVIGHDMGAGADGKLYPWGSNPHVPDARRLVKFEAESATWLWAGLNAPEEVRKRVTFFSRYLRHDWMVGWTVLDHAHFNEMVESSAAPIVSIVMPSWLRPESTRRAIRSCIDQTRGDWELIVVGDACPTTPGIVAEFDDKRIRFINLASHEGKWGTACRNVGIENATGKYLCFLDNDDYLLTDHIERRVAAIEASGMDMLYCDAIIEEGGDHKLRPASLRYGRVGNSELILLRTLAASVGIRSTEYGHDYTFVQDCIAAGATHKAEAVATYVVVKDCADPVTLITATGGRPEAFALCERWMQRQRYRGPIQWIVVDDCDPPTPATMGQFVIRPEPRWDGGNTHSRNLLAAIPHIQHERVLLIEDDDHYHPDWIAEMAAMLADHDLAGENFARYYNVRCRRYKEMHNGSWASACATAFRVSILPAFERRVKEYHKFDIRLWGDVPRRKLLMGRHLVHGIKGMPGRRGAASGHAGTGMRHDPTLAVLKNWIGDDARLYAGFSARDG